MPLSERQFRRITKALADPRRYEILKHIATSKELACSDLRCTLPITAATLSHHIKDLADAGLIDVRREGKYMHMTLRRDVWKQYVSALNRL
jgi:ArsR family transcriptional regulator